MIKIKKLYRSSFYILITMKNNKLNKISKILKNINKNIIDLNKLFNSLSEQEIQEINFYSNIPYEDSD